MKNQLQISIPEPCQEDWDKMIPTEQGRLCDACNKCVVDFTRFSDDELLAYFSNPPKNVCGRFDVKKLNTVISSPQKIHSPFAKRLFWGLAMVAGIGTTLKAQTTITNNKPSTEQEPFYHDETAVLAPQTTSDTTGVITGVVLDSATNEPLFAVSVFIEGTNIEASTDFDGKFKLVLPQEYLKKPFALKVAYVGYLPKRFTDIVYQKNQTPLYLTLVVNEALFGDCVVILPATRWQRIKGFFRRLF